MRGPLPDVDETHDHLTKPSMLLSIDFDEELTEEELEELDDLETDEAIRAALRTSTQIASSPEERALWEEVSRMFEEDNDE